MASESPSDSTPVEMPKRNEDSSGDIVTLPFCSATEKVAEWRYESAPENRSELEGIHALSIGITKASVSESGLIAATAPLANCLLFIGNLH